MIFSQGFLQCGDKVSDFDLEFMAKQVAELEARIAGRSWFERLMYTLRGRDWTRTQLAIYKGELESAKFLREAEAFIAAINSRGNPVGLSPT